MGVSVAQLSAKISVEGADQAQNSLQTVGAATSILGEKLASMKPLDLGRSITDEDVAQAKLTLLESQVSEAATKLKTLEAAADAGKSVTGINEAQANLVLLQARAQDAREKLQTLATASQEAGSGLQQMATPVERDESLLTRLSGVLKQVVSSAKETATAGASAGEGLGGFFSSVGGGIGSLLSFGSQIGMTIFGLQQMVQTVQMVGQALIGQNASMEQTQVAFTGLLGSSKAANAELKDLQQFAASTPFEFPDLAQSTQMLLGFGFQLKETKPLLTSVGDALSSMGRLSAATLQQVVMVFGQMHSSGHVMTGDLQQLTSVGINGFAILAQQMHVTEAQVRDMVTQGLIPSQDAINMLTQGIEKNPIYTGGMAKQSQTFNGLLSTLQDNAGAAWRTFTGPLFDKAKSGLESLGKLVSSKSFQDFATTMGTNVGNALKTVSDDLGSLGGWLQNVGKAFQTVGFQQFVQSVQNLAHTLADVLFPKLAPVKDGLKGIFSDQGASAGAANLANAFQFMAGVLNGLNSGIKSMQDTWHSVLPILQQIGGFLSAQFGPSFKQIGDEIQSQLVPAWNQLVTAMQPLMPVLEGIGIVIGAVVVTAFGILISTIVGIVGAIAGALPGIIQFVTGIIQIFTGMAQVVGGIFQLINDIVTGNFSKIGADLNQIGQGILTQFTGLWNIAAGIWNAGIGLVQGFLSGFVSTVIAFFTHLWNTLVGHSIIPDMINAIISWFARLPGEVIAFVSSLVSRAIGFFGVLAATAISKGSELVSGFVSRLAALPGQAGAKAQDAANAIRDKLSGLASSALTWGQNMISSFIQGIKNMAGQAGQAAQDVVNNVQNAFSNIHLPSISLPGHASGIMDSPQGHWAVVGEHGAEPMFVPRGASIFPNNMLSSLASLSRSTPTGVQVMPQTINTMLQGSSQPIIVNAVLEVDGRLMSLALLPHMTDAIRHGTGVWGV